MIITVVAVLLMSTVAFRLIVHFFLDFRVLAYMVCHWQMLSKRRFYLLYDSLDNRKLMQEINPSFKEHPSLLTSFLQQHSQNRDDA
jgi:Golgi nucleoside diphosphatase